MEPCLSCTHTHTHTSYFLNLSLTTFLCTTLAIHTRHRHEPRKTNVCWVLFQYTDMSYRFQYVFTMGNQEFPRGFFLTPSRKEELKQGYFSCCLKCVKCYCPNKWCSRWMPLLLHFCCPKPVQINCVGSVTGSLTNIPRRLLTQKWIFSEAYYYKVGASCTELKCYFSCLITQYLQNSLFIAKYQTHLELQAQGDCHRCL